MCFGITGSEARVARRRRLVGGISRDRLDAHDALFIATGEITAPAAAYAARQVIRLAGAPQLLELLEPRPGDRR